jgi:hypothetical protein
MLPSAIARTTLEAVLAFVPPAEIGTAHTGVISWLTHSVRVQN